MTLRRFKQVDVFTDRPFSGNPVAVVLDGDGISDREMQQIAAWTNLSETTFVLKPTAVADYRLRIFTPREELPFAGHPTIGSAHAVLEAKVIRPRKGGMVQECGVGDLPLRSEGRGSKRRIFLEAPDAALAGEYKEMRNAISDVLGSKLGDGPAPAAFNNGPTWLFAAFDTADEVAALEPDMAAISRLSGAKGLTGIAAFALLDGELEKVHIRCFAPAAGVPEDPVTGSANAALPAYLAHHGMLARVGREYVATQGAELGRDGHVFVRVLDENGLTEIGGQSVTVIEGEIRV